MSDQQAGRVLCRLEDIEDGEGKGFVTGNNPDICDIFVVREGDAVFGYANTCPHLGTPLDWQGEQFISEETGQIMCQTHGALFEFEDGSCIAGPCAGQSLKPVAVVVNGERQILLAGD